MPSEPILKRKLIVHKISDETINHIRCSKLVKKEYKARHNCCGGGDPLSKIMKFYLITKWYMHKLESFKKNETHKILWDFEIQKHQQIAVRRSVLLLIFIKRENLPYSELFESTKWK